jgi:carbon monoxide dehydrogenase subunit G
MFIIKSNVTETFEVQTSPDAAQKFYSDSKNYVELMPNLESIHTDAKGTVHWNIAVDVPMVGRWKMAFAVDFLSSADTVEWFPSPIEKQNYLMCVTRLVKKSENLVSVTISHNLELRRKQATDLHLLAGLAGEGMISGEMKSEVTKMLKSFIKASKERLEK